MLTSLSVDWTVTPRQPPEPWITCARCAGPQPFRPSGRFRLNANGRLLDAWLIYRCTICDATWNCPVFARRPVRAVDPALLVALQANDPALARRVAFDQALLRRHARRIDDCPEVEIARRITDTGGAGAATLSIRILPAFPLALRLDRLLAEGLALSRSRVERLAATGLLILDPPGALRQSLVRPVTAHLALAPLADGEAILAATLRGMDG